MPFYIIFTFVTFCVFPFTLHAQVPLTVVGWNVEQGFSPDSDIRWVSARLTDMDGVDIWGLTEISREYVGAYTRAAAKDEGSRFDFVMTEMSAGSDRMAIIYNADRLKKLWHAELEGFNYALSERTRNLRPPLAVHFMDSLSGRHFVVMVNHLARGNQQHRYTQARRLQQWVQQQSIPLIALGDYNFDWDVDQGETDHDKGYDILTQGGFFAWLRPQVLVRTQCTPTEKGGCRYNSVLDFIFVANQAKQWQGLSEIIVDKGDFPDDEIKADHRPVLARFLLPRY